MSKESRLTDERRKLIRPEVFEPEGWWNKQALNLVSTLRKASVKGGKLDLNIYLDAPPYFIHRPYMQFPSIDIAYVIQRDERIVLHRDRLDIYCSRVDRYDEFFAALKNKKISRIAYIGNIDPDLDLEAPDRAFISMRDGYITLAGGKIPNWEEG